MRLLTAGPGLSILLGLRIAFGHGFLNAKTSIRFEKRCAIKILRDNPLLDRLIEVGTKALGRELMSGETLRAPRQQLRRLRASAFDFEFPKNYSFSESFARLSGARLHFWRVRRWVEGIGDVCPTV